MLSSLPNGVTWNTIKNGDIDPNIISKKSKDIYIFNCSICKHEISDSVIKVTSRNNCKYCSPRWIHCENDECEFCLNKSFASNSGSNMWDFESNDTIPLYVPKNSMKNFNFLCGTCNHKFIKNLNSFNRGNNGCPYCSKTKWKYCGDSTCEYCFKRSFASVEKSKYWHPTKNGEITPFHITRSNDKIYWFQCDKCPHAFEKTISNITRKDSWCSYCSLSGWKHCDDDECKFCFDRSFASNPKSKYWHPTKNGKIYPLSVSKCNGDKYWFHCQECDHDINLKIDSIHSGNWCRFCSKTNWVHCEVDNCKWCFNRSFASHTKAKYWHKTKNVKNILTVAMHARGDFWFTCNKCDHDFSLQIYNITGNTSVWCCYCSKTNWKHCGNKECKWCFERSFASHPKSIQWHEDNTENILNIARFSMKKCKFTCEECEKTFITSIAGVSNGNWCGKCKNKTENKLLKWLNEKFPDYKITHQAKFDWCKSKEANNHLPFDFCINDLKLIISLDGDQHFRQVLNWKSEKYAQERDVYKMILALDNGYSIIRLYQDDVWRDRQNWEIKLQKLIENIPEKLSFVTTNKKMVNDIYDIYKEKCKHLI
jgi:Marseilleviridae restriction endonuclease